MEFYLDSSSRTPLYRQLVDQVRYAISVGELVPGDALPSLRELETLLGVNRNTVRRAYLELHMEGTLAKRAGRESVVAPRASAARGADREASLASGSALAEELLQRGEAIGLDAISLAEFMVGAARAHDERHPRCAFLECSDRQAAYLADHAAARLGRRVVPINLHALRNGMDSIPASVQFILTPHWHVADAEALADRLIQTVVPVGVQVTPECAARLRAISDGGVGLVVRDAQSLPGFCERLRQHAGQARIEGVLVDDRDAVRAMTKRVDHVVYTPPCADVIQSIAPCGLSLYELVFEASLADLDAFAQTMFPPLSRQKLSRSD